MFRLPSISSASLLLLAIISLMNVIQACKTRVGPHTEQLQHRDSTSQHAVPVSARPVHWGYEGEHGPAAWSTLSPVYAPCAEGKSQSPINLGPFSTTGSEGWKVNYKTTSLKIAHHEHMTAIIDNGHTIQVKVDEGSTLTIREKTYHLKQFHFHIPSEHTLEGKHLPMEMHMVHQSEDGNLAVVGILYQEGKIPDDNLAKIIANLPTARGDSIYISNLHHELKIHIPEDTDAYHYVGSFTTPPCSENVQWLVLRNTLTLTADQLRILSDRISPNNRPTQPLHDRKVEGIQLNKKIK